MQHDRSTSSERSVEPADTEEWELIEDEGESLLSVRDLVTQFETPDGTVHAVDGVSFEIEEGEVLGLVGESGCGKSVTSLSLMRLIDSPGEIVDGEIVFDGKDVLDLSREELRRLRGNEISFVFQEPSTALNPVFDVGWQIGEPLRIHRDLADGADRERAVELMERVGIPGAEDRLDDYPHEFSGGMSQRAMLSMALACEPSLLIADEPTTALDVTIEAQILDLLLELKEDIGMSILLVTHDLGVVAQTCDRVAVMYLGRIVEYGDVEDIFADPRHPYTKGLLGSIPNPEADVQDLEPIPGELPDPSDPPAGCNFRGRCPYAVSECESTDPRLREVDDGHYSACIWEDPE